MEDRPRFMSDGGQFLDGFDSSDFVIGMHDRNQCRGAGPNGLPESVRFNLAVRIDRQHRQFKALLGQELAGMQHRMMFDRRGNNMITFVPVVV